MKKVFEDIGKRVIGRGSEANFAKEVDEYEKMYGVSAEEAKKEIFMVKMQELSDEMLNTGSIDFNSPEYKNLFAGMREIFDSSEIENFKSSAETKRVSGMPMSRPSVSTAEFARMKKQFQTEFPQKNAENNKKRMPSNPELRDAMQNTKMIDELVNTLMTDPRVASSSDLEATIAAHPDLQEQLGEILLSKASIDRQKNMIESSVNFDESAHKTKEQTKKVLGNGVNEMWKYLSKSVSLAMRGNIEGTVKHVFGGSVALGAKAVVGTAKLGYAGSKTSMSFLRSVFHNK